MTQQLTQKMIKGTGLCAAFALVFLLGRLSALPHGEKSSDKAAATPAAPHGSAASVAEASSPEVPATPAKSPEGPAIDPTLAVANAGLEKAKHGLAGATPRNHGGWVQLARADVANAMKTLAAASAYATAHPDAAATPAELSAESQKIATRITEKTFATPNKQGNLVEALAGLKIAADALKDAPGGTIGGNRDKLFADLDQALLHTTTAFDFVQTGGIPKAAEATGAKDMP